MEEPAEQRELARRDLCVPTVSAACPRPRSGVNRLWALGSCSSPRLGRIQEEHSRIVAVRSIGRGQNPGAPLAHHGGQPRERNLELQKVRVSVHRPAGLVLQLQDRDQTGTDVDRDAERPSVVLLLHDARHSARLAGRVRVDRPAVILHPFEQRVPGRQHLLGAEARHETEAARQPEGPVRVEKIEAGAYASEAVAQSRQDRLQLHLADGLWTIPGECSPRTRAPLPWSESHTTVSSPPHESSAADLTIQKRLCSVVSAFGPNERAVARSCESLARRTRMRAPTTLKTAVSIEGVGLHSGHPVRAHFRPAPAGHGLVFYRLDHQQVPIAARLESATTFDYATTLASGGVSIGTVEHVLSAAYGEGLDNCRIEIEGPEVPILDGSALPFVRLFHAPGSSARTLRWRPLRPPPRWRFLAAIATSASSRTAPD